jgi:hypothetical protein
VLLANTVRLDRVDNGLVARKKDVSNQASIDEDTVRLHVVEISVITIRTGGDRVGMLLQNL